jgi:CRP-like cAMP-binding protein
MAEETRCVCNHSMAAHGLRGDPGCSFCSCRQFRRPSIDEAQIDLTRYASKALDLLLKSSVFKDTPKDVLIQLVKDGHGRVYGPGAYLIHHNDVSPMMHVILAGYVNVETQAQAPGAKTVRTELGPGALVGDLRAFTEQPRWASISAEDNVETLEIDTSKLRGLFATAPELMMTLARMLAPYSATTDEMIDATVNLAVDQFSSDAKSEERREGLDPAKAMEIRARWQQLKEKDLAEQRAQAAARAAINQQLQDHRRDSRR